MRNEDYWKAGIRSLFFFFPLPKRLLPISPRMEFVWRGRWKENEKSALSWEMEHGIRERMHFLTGIPGGNGVLWSLPKVEPRHASLLARRTRGKRIVSDSKSCSKDNIHRSMHRFRIRFFFVSFLSFFLFFPPVSACLDRMADRAGRFGRVETGDDTFEI